MMITFGMGGGRKRNCCDRSLPPNAVLTPSTSEQEKSYLMQYLISNPNSVGLIFQKNRYIFFKKNPIMYIFTWQM